MIYLFSPLLVEMIQFDDYILFKWVETTNINLPTTAEFCQKNSMNDSRWFLGGIPPTFLRGVLKENGFDFQGAWGNDPTWLIDEILLFLNMLYYNMFVGWLPKNHQLEQGCSCK